MSFVNPAPQGQQGRIDAGVDYSNIHGPIVAVAQGIISSVYKGLSGFGNTIVEKLSSGQSVYYALESGGQPIGLSPGQAVSQGQTVAAGRGSGVIEVGFWNPATGRAIDPYQGTPTPAGIAFNQSITRTTSSAPRAPAAVLSPTQQGVAAAAQKWNVPPSILWGVYGMETGFGRDVATSSANAKGSFQFLKSTAAQYNYPYTNATDTNTFNAQADAAAHYLSDLFSRYGTWDAALRAYSGGGYGLAQVSAKGASFNNFTAGSTPYGGTRPGGSSGGSGGSDSSGPDLYTAYTTLRDQPRVPSGPQDVVDTAQNPFGWFLHIWKGEWDAISSGAKTVGTAFGDATRLTGDVVKTLELLPFYTLRAVELIIGFVVVWVGIKQSSGAARNAGESLRHITSEVVQATPGLGAEVRMAQGRRMGRREGQREAARISARGSEVARRRRNANTP